MMTMVHNKKTRWDR